jgi:Arc/MetJ-type ribon-helix-helix transcriptional regulator
MSTEYPEIMPRNDYHSITLPEGLYETLEQFVQHSNGHYVSIAEVVREALRIYLKKQREQED